MKIMILRAYLGVETQFHTSFKKLDFIQSTLMVEILIRISIPTPKINRKVTSSSLLEQLSVLCIWAHGHLWRYSGRTRGRANGWMDGKKNLKVEKRPKNSFGCLFKVKRVKPLFYLNQGRCMHLVKYPFNKVQYKRQLWVGSSQT